MEIITVLITGSIDMKSELKKCLQNDRKRILGVYLWEKYIYLAGLIREDPHWSVLFFSKELQQRSKR